MAINIPTLPYALDALEPHISKETLEYHFGKHHQAYANKGNAMIEGTEFEQMNEEEMMKKSFNSSELPGLFNNVAQVWNHSFYWNSMKPNGGGEPSSSLAEQINKDFGSFDKFKEEFAKAGATQFGSGWAWLVSENNTLKVVKTANANNPLTSNQIPLLTMDVWEHAYYIDYRNARPKYISSFLENLVNWEFAQVNLDKLN